MSKSREDIEFKRLNSQQEQPEIEDTPEQAMADAIELMLAAEALQVVLSRGRRRRSNWRGRQR